MTNVFCGELRRPFRARVYLLPLIRGLRCAGPRLIFPIPSGCQRKSESLRRSCYASRNNIDCR